MQGWRFVAAVVLALGVAAPAQAYCGRSVRLMMPVEFADGSVELVPGLAERARSFAIVHGEPGLEIDGLSVTVMGDLGEGAEYDAADEEARARDRALAEARLAAIREALQPLGKKIVDTRVRESRQVFSAEDVARNPMLNERVRAGIFLSLMAPRPPAKKGEPVPTC